MYEDSIWENMLVQIFAYLNPSMVETSWMEQNFRPTVSDVNSYKNGNVSWVYAQLPGDQQRLQEYTAPSKDIGHVKKR